MSECQKVIRETEAVRRVRAIRETVSKAPPLTALQRAAVVSALTGGVIRSPNRSEPFGDQTRANRACLGEAAQLPARPPLRAAS
jgi:hypothetical protein